MIQRVIRGAALTALVALVSPSVCVMAADNPAAVQLKGWAGIGGVAKANRWTPLIVGLDIPQPFRGSLRVTWGDLRVTRELAVPAAGRHLIEIALRTSNPEANVRLQLVGDGIMPVSLDVPVRILDQNEPVTLCVTADGTSGDAACSATTTVDLLPRSLRGYESIDAIVWGSTGVRPAAEQQKAIDAWQALRVLETSGNLGLVPKAARPAARRGIPAPASLLIAVAAVVYAAVLTTAGVGLGFRRWKLLPVLAALSVVVAAGSGVVMAIGRVGPGNSVRLEHSSLLEQIPGSHVALLTVEALATYPAYADTSLELPLADATIEWSTASGRGEQFLNEHGTPAVRGVHALAERRAFEVEGVLEVQPLVAVMNGRRWTISNHSDLELFDCRFGSGFSTVDGGELLPGTQVTAEQVGDIIGPAFTCTTDMPLVAPSDGNRRVDVEGPTVIALYPGSVSNPAAGALR